ncbi:MAG: tRNA pseudouridine(55) synthase TruB, partial [Thermodesulfobacteriota bacterium]|nr:tRNA pseudouridine(55) synthase TruB [Thermodesulfobacteriota bacterium]
MGNNHDGILLIDKNEGETSFDIVKRIRQNSMVKKAGHAGTLDPFATGLLIVLLGQGTKLTPYFMESEKIYRAIMRLGIETDTQDPTGQVLHSRPVPDFTQGYIKEKAKNFIGEIEQTPPAFSALNYKGKRAYEFARKGIRIDLEKRRVKIHSIEIISINLPDITMEIRCSKGTYIRTLAADMGKRLGPGAHLKALTRLAIGSFRVEDALDSMDTAFS